MKFGGKPEPPTGWFGKITRRTKLDSLPDGWVQEQFFVCSRYGEEVEEEEKKLKQKMDQDIKAFMQSYPQAFPAGRPLGKLSAYFHKFGRRM